MKKDTFISGLLVNSNGDMIYMAPDSDELTEKQFLAVQFLASSLDEIKNDLGKQ